MYVMLNWCSKIFGLFNTLYRCLLIEVSISERRNNLELQCSMIFLKNVHLKIKCYKSFSSL